MGSHDKWTTLQRPDDAERARLAVLNALPEKNPPGLLAPVRVKVLRPFCVAGERQEIGAIVDLQRHDAVSLEAIKKCQILK